MTPYKPEILIHYPGAMGRWLIKPMYSGEDSRGLTWLVQDRYEILDAEGTCVFEKRIKSFTETHDSKKEYENCSVCICQPKPMRKYGKIPDDELLDVEFED